MAGKNAHVTFKSIAVRYEHTPYNQSMVLNPQAIVNTLNPQIMLRRDKPQGFSEHAVCLILDEVI